MFGPTTSVVAGSTMAIIVITTVMKIVFGLLVLRLEASISREKISDAL